MLGSQAKSVLVPISKGFEEIETIAIVDILRRGGAKVILACADPNQDEELIVEGTNGIKVVCDTLMTDDLLRRDFDMIALTGGQPNAENLGKCERLVKKLQLQKQNGKLLAAICSAPCVILERNGLLQGEQATCAPQCCNELKDKSRCQERVVISNQIITSQGPGTAVDFGLCLLEKLYDKEKSMDVARKIINIPSEATC